MWEQLIENGNSRFKSMLLAKSRFTCAEPSCYRILTHAKKCFSVSSACSFSEFFLSCQRNRNKCSPQKYCYGRSMVKKILSSADKL